MKAVGPLTAPLKDQVRDVRYEAILALGKMMAFDQKDTLKELIRNQREDLQLRLPAAAVLLRFGEEEGLNLITETSDNRYYEMRRVAATP